MKKHMLKYGSESQGVYNTRTNVEQQSSISNLQSGVKNLHQAKRHISPSNPDNSSFIHHFQDQKIDSALDTSFYSTCSLQIVNTTCKSPRKKYQLQNISRRMSPAPADSDIEKSREILGLEIEQKLKDRYGLTFKPTPKKRFLLKTSRKQSISPAYI